MRNSAVSNLSFWRLIEQFAEDVKCFVREEGKLAKAELTEKVGHLARKAVPAAIGGCVAYTGLTLLLLAIGMIVAYGFQRLGIDPLLAAFAGIGVTAILVIVIGSVLLIKGVRALSKATMKPEKTVEALENIKPQEARPESAAERVERMRDEKDYRTSTEIQETVFALEGEIADTLSELGRRVSLTTARQHAVREIRAHPYRWGLVAMGTGLVGSFLLKKKSATI
jgi:hypothetical protein